jgi:hypothetical protein
VHSFLVCRQITTSPQDGELVLVCPFDRITAWPFPAEVPLSVFARLTDARGRYVVGLQLVDADGEVVWARDECGVVEEFDPLSMHRLTFLDMKVRLPGAGRYDLVIVANGEPLARHALQVRGPS